MLYVFRLANSKGLHVVVKSSASSWLFKATLLSYGLADSLMLVMIVQRNELGWGVFGWYFASVFATAVGTTMALSTVRTLSVRFVW